jgi:hypothetical protein
MTSYSGIPSIDLGLNIFFGTDTAITDPTAGLSADCLKRWAKSGKINLTTGGAFALFLGSPQAVTSFFAGDEITVYGNKIDEAGADKDPFMAIILAHEGVHASQRSVELESEVDAWSLSVIMFRELVKKPVRVDAVDYQISSPNQFNYTKAGPYYDKGQMIDYLLEVKAYKEKVRAYWVAGHYKDWGGITTRTPATISLYLERLALGGGAYGSQIMEILEQALPTLPTPKERQDTIDAAGAPLRKTLGEMRYSNDYVNRIKKLETSAGVKFRL